MRFSFVSTTAICSRRVVLQVGKSLNTKFHLTTLFFTVVKLSPKEFETRVLESPRSAGNRLIIDNVPSIVYSCKPSYQVTFIRKDGERITASGKEGDSLLDVVVNNNLDFDGYGACEGTLTCSTCHVILKKEDYDRIPNSPGDEEMDMLDLAYELSDT
ncbi:hypothetical protein ACFE04_016278 [Oxalis oulophora]